MTHFLNDILRQPSSLASTLDYLNGTGHQPLQSAADAVRNARHVFLTGMGSSYHAALSAASLFYTGSYPVHLLDAAELLHFATIPTNSVVIVVSRSGQSVEVVQLLAAARAAGAIVIGLTNTPEGPLAREAQVPVVVPVTFDHGISVNTYSTLAAAASALASATLNSFDHELSASLLRAVAQTAEFIPRWQEQLADTIWPLPRATYYFLARGSSLGSCQEARLMWEEGCKWPATAMGTGSFRHGPQEMLAEGSRFGLWIDGESMREEDLAVARDLRRLGASVMLIGHGLFEEAGDLVFQIPRAPAGWQFLFDIIPAQLVAERLAALSGVDCDTFRYCSYIVRGEHGLLAEQVAAEKDKR